MKALRLAMAKLLREWRAGEHTVLLLALLVAVTALTTISFFTDRVDRSLAERANEVLAADLRLQSRVPLNEDYAQHARQLGLSVVSAQAFNSVIVFGDNSSLSSTRAVTTGYPLRGRVKVADRLDAVAYETNAVPQPGEIWADPRLLARLNADVGSEVQVGRRQMRVGKVITYRPDQGSQFVELAPTVLMRVEDVASTGLIGIGSRVQYRLLFAGERSDINELGDWLRTRLTGNQRLEGLGDASPQLQTAVERGGRFLNLTGLTSVLLAGVAVAMAARRYATRHLDTVALMKSMGASQRLVLSISVLELAMLGLIAGVLGTVLGYGAQLGVAYVASGLFTGELPAPGWRPALLGVLTPLIVLGGFALPPLLQLKRVPPARVLRHNAAPPQLRYFVVYGIAMAAVLGLLLVLVRDLRLVLYVTAGLIATIAVLWLAGTLLVRSVTLLRGSVGVAWRYGVANIARRGRESVVQLVAFGVGLMVLLLLVVVRNDLLNEWRASLPENAPNQFLINITPTDREPLQQFFAGHGIEPPILVPMVRARLVSINDVSAAELRPRDEDGRGFLEREANLTWSATLPEGNQLIEGQWWKADEREPQISIEKRIVASLGLKLGDRVTYDVSGTEVTARVTSIRDVQWDSFKPNFFVVFSPGVLDDLVGTYLTSVHLAADKRGIMSEFYRQFPEITAIDIEALLAQIRSVMDSAILAIQWVFAFSLLAGITVLLAAIQSTRDERRYESAMLRTLGATRRVVLQSVAAEFLTLGLLAGILAAFAASVVGFYFATRIFNLGFQFNIHVWWIGMLSGVILVGGTGVAVTRSVVSTPPAVSLRET